MSFSHASIGQIMQKIKVAKKWSIRIHNKFFFFSFSRRCVFDHQMFLFSGSAELWWEKEHVMWKLLFVFNWSIYHFDDMSMYYFVFVQGSSLMFERRLNDFFICFFWYISFQFDLKKSSVKKYDDKRKRNKKRYFVVLYHDERAFSFGMRCWLDRTNEFLRYD